MQLIIQIGKSDRTVRVAPVRLHGVVGMLACKIGMHRWRSDSDYFVGIAKMKEITLVWWQCERCAHSKLKCILR